MFGRRRKVERTVPLSYDAQHVMVAASALAGRRGAAWLTADQVLAMLLTLPTTTGTEVLEACGVDVAEVGSALELHVRRADGSAGGSEVRRDGSHLALESEAALAAMRLGDDVVGTEHLVVAALHLADTEAARLLAAAGATAEDVDAALRAVEGRAHRGDRLAAAVEAISAAQAWIGVDPAQAIDELAARINGSAVADPRLAGELRNHAAWTTAVHLVEARYEDAARWIDEAHRLGAWWTAEAIDDTRCAVGAVRGEGRAVVAGLLHTLERRAADVGDDRLLTHAFLAVALLDAGAVEEARPHVAAAQARDEPIVQLAAQRLAEADGRSLPE